MADALLDRMVLLRSRSVLGYRLTASGENHLQHILIDWFPRAVYPDLTDDTHHLDVTIRKSFTGKSAFATAFVRADGTVIKSSEYSEEQVVGKECSQYDPTKTSYRGQRYGFDVRMLYYRVRAG